MNIKTDHNLLEACMDAWAESFKEYLSEDNLCAESYYEIQKLVHSLSLPSEMIDVCIDNCMIYWRKDAELLECKFCKKPRYKPEGRGRNRVPYQRMWYLPITDRLKRLYQSEKTAASMRWHAEHTQKEGEINHPSDAKAWKHLNSVHKDFASNIRNVYLGLCTDGFSPFGMSGRQYSLWPVIRTSYNLPPERCMEREFLFMSILIHVPKHPKWSLDVFLQPLIEELKELWLDYAWETSLSLLYGKQRCISAVAWSKVVVRDTAPPYLSREEIEKDIDYYGAEETISKGGNWHTTANMAAEKNFVDNIINTLLNVSGKTKDNKNSRLDLLALCSRSELHIKDDEKIPVPIFRLPAEAKAALFKWVTSDVKFSDGYVSNLSRCVEQGHKFSGMKSHDCHVFIKRFLPFAFAELLPKNVHEALASIGAFFRDLSSRTLTEDVIRQLDENIWILMCNMEKIFPPSFFNVIEHLVVHLTYETLLRGPVHNGWMYPYERSMKHLKGKSKNLARVEGLIVSWSLNEETSHFTLYYFGSQVRTRKRAPTRYDDDGVMPRYIVEDVPYIFCQIRRLGGKLKEVWWSSTEDAQIVHTYILLNCEEMQLFESDFVDQVKETIPEISTNDLNKRKDQHFVDYDDPDYSSWVHELIQGLVAKVTTTPMYFTQGYNFHTYEYGSRRATVNYGICVKGERYFYGILQEIIEVEFPGLVKMKCVLFKCDWFDPTENRGVRYNKFGVVDINATRSRYKSYTSGRVLSDEQPPWQEDVINEVDIPEKATDEILLVDPQNPRYEDLPYEVADEAIEDEFEERDDPDDGSDDE
ncbi:PREDICTED: uncharacterized protein LOC106324422 [Brassica oleracea var. oleracea]|uniref:uncharacterized protein LOC106324422 n=1 Tax=Brassica oleracea var. oleracea TaxID=109376 RepID=UPI0006A73667|nr:PREDICTED: uncharacterized protein LOC106324422 [Brassica oleracea var. oleracea]